MTINELTARLADVIPQLPSKRIFTIIPTGLQLKDSLGLENIVIVETPIDIPIVNEIIQYLVYMGFLINIHDNTDNTRCYWQLTDKGRDLKDVGSIEAYARQQQIREVKKFDLEALKKGARFWLKYFLAVFAGIGILYNIMYYSNKLQEVAPIDPPTPFFVCIWLNIIVITIWLFRQNPKTVKNKN